MKKYAGVLILLWKLSICSLTAQNQLAVSNGGNPSFYPNLDSAMTYAQHGDTIFVPGGIFVSDTLKIAKLVHLIGVGMDTDSAQATAISKLVGPVRVLTGADGGSMTGFYLEDNLQFGTNSGNVEVHQYTFDRCYFKTVSLAFLNNTNTFSNSTDIIFLSSIIDGSLNGGQSMDCKIFNCLIEGNAGLFGAGTIFQNNVFLRSTHVLSFSDQLQVINNIFLAHSNVFFQNTVTNSVFRNNLSKSTFFAASNTSANNIFWGPSTTTIFESQSGNGFSFSHDYRLKPGVPGKNAGTDGADVGIFGGPFAWKPGHIPFNPHLSSSTISSATNNSGLLNVNLTVRAQNK